jgi:hexosaminidase
MKRIFIALLLLLNIAPAIAQNQYHIIPKPKQLQPRSGSFMITEETKIIVPANDIARLNIGDMLSYQLLTTMGRKIEVSSENSANSIYFTTVPNLPEEAYGISVTPKRVLVSASSAKGHFYGLQTLMQLLPTQIYSSTRQGSDVKWEIPACTIFDEPRYEYRGGMLDVGRHFMPVAFIKKYIDLLAMHKMNKFHWHLTEDQGWRIEIKKYPKLTEIGSNRKETMKGHYTDNAYDATPYGGFYTQDEVREIVKYAASKYIEVIPEIEMPGHALAAITAYPELGCGGKTYEVGTRWGVYEDIFCPTEKTFTFLEDVLTEVIDLFPGQYIHIGGDEAPKTVWENSKFVQKLKKEQDLKDEHEVQSYFIKRIDKFLTSKGKKMIGWDEILEGGLSPNAIIMSWRGEEGGIAAAKAGHYAIMTPTSSVYLDYYQGDPATEPLAIGGFLPLENVYKYNPTSDKFPEDAQKYVLGTQANLWTEYVKTPEKAEYMLFPRLTAVAEIAWTPNELKNYDDFTNRLETHFERLRNKAVNYAKTYYNVDFKTGVLTRGQPVIMLSTADKEATVRYTSDGSQPNEKSLTYKEGGILLTEDATITTAAYGQDGKQLGNAVSKFFNISKSTGRPYTLTEQPQGYTGGETYALSNGIKGIAGNTSTWVGFNGKDMNATFDFGRSNNFRNVTLAFYNAPDLWIVSPKSVEVFVSEDGKTFKSVKQLEVTPIMSKEVSVRQVSLNLPANVNGRYIKVVAKNFGDLPKNSPGNGNPAWLFVDEIGIE